MPLKPINLNYSLYQILIEDQLDNFSVLELRDAFLVASNSIDEKEKARRFVYRNILRLEKMQLLKKVTGKVSKKPNYKKTTQFMSTIWNTVTKENKSEVNSRELKRKSDDLLLPQTTLQNRLEQCENDFLACIHEFETYKNLCSEFPHLTSSLLEVRYQAKTQRSKLVGEIRAIKMALTLS